MSSRTKDPETGLTLKQAMAEVRPWVSYFVRSKAIGDGEQGSYEFALCSIFGDEPEVAKPSAALIRQVQQYLVDKTIEMYRAEQICDEGIRMLNEAFGKPKSGRWYHSDGLDAEGFNADGLDDEGRDRDGYDKDGYGRPEYCRYDGRNHSFNKAGFDAQGFDRRGHDKDGFNKDGQDPYGFYRSRSRRSCPPPGHATA